MLLTFSVIILVILLIYIITKIEDLTIRLDIMDRKLINKLDYYSVKKESLIEKYNFPSDIRAPEGKE